jgi:hypothetical protein
MRGMERVERGLRILGTAFDIRDTATLIYYLLFAGGGGTLVTATINWLGDNVPPLSLLLYGVGTFLILVPMIPGIFKLVRKAFGIKPTFVIKHKQFPILLYDGVKWEDRGLRSDGTRYIVGPLCPKDLTDLRLKRNERSPEWLKEDEAIDDYRKLYCVKCGTLYTFTKAKQVREARSEAQDVFDGQERLTKHKHNKP